MTTAPFTQTRFHWDAYLDWGCWMAGVNFGWPPRSNRHFYLHLGPLILGVWTEVVVRP